jgi:hypothetical protein
MEKGWIQSIGKEMLLSLKQVLLLKIILKYTKTLLLFTGNTKQKLFTKVIKNAKLNGLG